MNKWGVRLIAFFFLIEAIYYFLPIITKIWHATGLWGLDLAYTIAFLYTGVQLLRFHPNGRSWALFIWWLITVFAGLFLFSIIWQVVFSIDFGGPKWLDERLRPIFALLVSFGFVILCYAPIHFLTRKDVKQLFEKATVTETIASTSETSSSS
jgi:hypothetical protein